MPSNIGKDQLIDPYLFETSQLLEQLETILLESEKDHLLNKSMINEIFRIMHTIKGNSAMMDFESISSLTHSVEDLFYFIRDLKSIEIDFSLISDLLFKCVDFIKGELEKIKSGEKLDEDPASLKESIQILLSDLKGKNICESNNSQADNTYIKNENDKSGINTFKSTIFFEEGCEMENIRAYGVVHTLKNITEDFYYIPQDILDEESINVIRTKGFTIILNTDKGYDEIYNLFQETVFLKDMELTLLKSDEVLDEPKLVQQNVKENNNNESNNISAIRQSIISVNMNKLDKIMDLVGELVISEAMVTQNPELLNLELENFHNAARQLRKITYDLQDAVLSVRMMPLTTTFHRMNRVVRDMSKNLNKDVQFELIGEETEVDKNVIENIADPIMHLIRNSIDHGIETFSEREKRGKNDPAKVTLEAKNSGGEVLILVKDNGRGLNKEKILSKAKENGLLNKSESEMSDNEIYNLIFIPGFSTKESVSEYSGRGVGLDVVVKNVGAIGGTILIDSILGEGSTFTIKIPLTLAIINGINVKVGKSIYTIPTKVIKKSFVAKDEEIMNDLDGNELIMFRGKCYPVLRLNELYGVKTEIKNIADGIMMMIENETKAVCMFVDELIGEQQVVVKALPNYIKYMKKIRGVFGCTLLGNGEISLILDSSDLVS